MSAKISEQQKFDPWENKQEITGIRVSILCCRYSMLCEWECENLSSPFWRIYHSRLGGGYIKFERKTIEIIPGSIIIISPNTPFSSHLKYASKPKNDSIKSIRISDEKDIALYQKEGMTDQMFVHFKLGFPYDRIKPGIHQFEISEAREQQIRAIEQKMIEVPHKINFQNNLAINYLVLYSLQLLPSFLWDIQAIDERILKIIRHIDNHIAESLTNEQLSNLVSLAKNSFARLFKENIKCSVQQFIQQRRIEHAITIFHHSNIKIEDVALSCGFYDRHHFSRVFKKITGVSPGSYWKW